MRRPTVRSVAEAAGLSIATVNRVLSGQGNVRPATMDKVLEAARSIGFYGSAAIEGRVTAARSRYTLGFLLNQPSRAWYQNLAAAIRNASASTRDCTIEVLIEFQDDLSPEHTVERMTALAKRCDAIAVVAAVHPLVTQTIEALQGGGTPVFALISHLSATGQIHYVGLDNWKVGRTAGWAMAHICKQPGKLGILVGNHRYRCQEMNEVGFRSYFREHAPDFSLLEPLSTFETRAVAQEMTERLLRENSDLAGLYVAGGGISGVIQGLRASKRAGQLVVVGYELMDVTREALLDGTLTFVISHPLDRLAREAIDRMKRAASEPTDGANHTSILPFEIYTRENI
jgi:LacI family transcriptional regulator